MLTREEVERRLAFLDSLSELYSPQQHGHGLYHDALQTALAAMDERDALAAEGRRLREALEAIASGLFHPSQLRNIAKTGLLKSPLISVEADRVRRLEAVLEAAEAQDPPASANLARALAAYREGERPGGEV